MKIYNEGKTKIIDNPDLKLGCLKLDKLITKIPEVKEEKEEGFFKTIREYENGGKDVEWVVTKEGKCYSPEETIIEDIYVYIPYTPAEIEAKNLLEIRQKREMECFSVINRGILWYESLTDSQKEELKTWYNKWLDVTETKTIPEKPIWLNK